MSTPTKAAEIIREALEYGKQARPRSPLFDRALALLADMERKGEPVKHTATCDYKRQYAGSGYPCTCHPSPTTADAMDSPVDELRDALKGIADWLDGQSMGTWQYMEVPNFYGDKQAHIENARAILAKYPQP